MKSAPLLSMAMGLAAIGAAQVSPVGAPILGYVFDRSANQVRPIQGIAGAALIGAPLEANAALNDAFASGGQGYLLGLRAGTGEVLLLRPLEGRLAGAPLAGAAASPDRIAYSPSGTAAVLWYVQEKSFVIATGLADAPVVSRRVSAPSLGAPLAALAVSDDGAVIVASAGSDRRLMVQSGESFLELPVPGAVTALAFRARTKDMLAATSDRQVWYVEAAGDDRKYRMVLDGFSGAGEPMAVEFSADGRRFITAAKDGNIAVGDLAGGEASIHSCACALSGLRRMNNESVFLLNDLSEAPLRLLDTSQSDPRVLFVPALGDRGSDDER